jgi:hypothetical protein
MSGLRCSLPLFLFLVASSLVCPAQGRKFPSPPEPAERTITTQKPAGTPVRQEVNFLELQREARELSDLAHTVPTDIDNVGHGLLPKDLVDKLKRIERLSKRLRNEISH